MTKQPARKPRPPARRQGETKREATRRTLLERALELFQKRGVDATTMRDIARAAGLSLGAAYYHFPSKEALVFAFYEESQKHIEELAAAQTTGTLRERLGAIFHGKLESIRPHRAMLASIVANLVNPGDPLSAFSPQTRSVRIRAIAIFERAIAGALPPAAVPIMANALWLLQLGCLLVFVHDDSPGQRRTHGLVDDGLDLLVPLLPLVETPAGAALCERIAGALARAGIALNSS